MSDHKYIYAGEQKQSWRFQSSLVTASNEPGAPGTTVENAMMTLISVYTNPQSSVDCGHHTAERPEEETCLWLDIYAATESEHCTTLVYLSKERAKELHEKLGKHLEAIEKDKVS